jgi:hypothetical protein
VGSVGFLGTRFFIKEIFKNLKNQGFFVPFTLESFLGMQFYPASINKSCREYYYYYLTGTKPVNNVT